MRNFLLLIVSLQILNVGLFTQNFPTNISFHHQNIINSVTEYIAEVLLKKSDSIPENYNHLKHHKSTSHTLVVKILKTNLFSENTNFKTNSSTLVLKKNFVTLSDKIFKSNFRTITAPPPKSNMSI